MKKFAPYGPTYLIDLFWNYMPKRVPATGMKPEGKCLSAGQKVRADEWVFLLIWHNEGWN